MKYFIELAYHGGRYHGWQRQKNAVSVQETLEDHLSQLLKAPLKIAGCGRTDTGVHASRYFAQFRTKTEINEEFLFRINKMLPQDIAVYSVFKVDDKAHVQHDAISRTYEYHFHPIKDPLVNQTSVEIDMDETDVQLMQRCLEIVKETQDFRVACRTPKSYKTTICDIHKSELSIHDDGLVIRFTANRFLRAMIRILVSKVLKVAAGRMDYQQFCNHFRNNMPFQFYEPAPPQGLRLTNISYPYELNPLYTIKRRG